MCKQYRASPKGHQITVRGHDVIHWLEKENKLRTWVNVPRNSPPLQIMLSELGLTHVKDKCKMNPLVCIN